MFKNAFYNLKIFLTVVKDIVGTYVDFNMMVILQADAATTVRRDFVEFEIG